MFIFPNCFIREIEFKRLVSSKSLIVFFVILNCDFTFLVPCIIKHYDFKRRLCFVSHNNFCYFQILLLKLFRSKIFFTLEEKLMKTFAINTFKRNIQRIQILIICLHNQWFQLKFSILWFFSLIA